jgi:hypothetical protein
MAVAAVLLATVVASSLSGGPPPGDPRASFTFDVENDTVLVRHYGGDTLDGSALAVESGERGRLGTFDGSDGMACVANVTRVRPGSVCRVPGAASERLYVVWEGPENRSLILAERAPDPTPTPAPETASPTPTPTPTATPAATPGTTAPGTPSPTASPGDTGTDASTATPAPTVTATPSPTPTPTAVPTPTDRPTPEPNAPVESTPTPTPRTNGTDAGSDS